MGTNGWLRSTVQATLFFSFIFGVYLRVQELAENGIGVTKGSLYADMMTYPSVTICPFNLEGNENIYPDRSRDWLTEFRHSIYGVNGSVSFISMS